MRFVKTAESLFGLPSGFQRVEYLESTGTQYIDTGIKYNINKTYQIKNKMVYTATQAQSQGNGWDAGGQNSINTTGDIQVGGLIVARNVIGKVIELTQTINSGSSTLSVYNYMVDGISFPEASRSHTSLSQYAGDGGYGIFAMYSTSDYNYFCKAKCYKYKILENNVLVRDFIPCIDPLGRACMYDLVGKKAYYKQGTGEFTVGRQIIPVEYIESFRPNTSDGYALTQYINTKIIPNQNTKIILDAEMTQNYTTSSASDYYEIFVGSFKSTTGFRIGYHISGGKGYFGYILGSSYTSYSDLVEADLNRHIFVLDAKNSVFSIDNNSYQSSYSMSGEQNPVALFAQRGTSAFNASANMKCYGCKIYDDNTLIADYTPCKDENNVGFMFDTLSGTVYGNSGTGAFAVGQNKYKMKLRLIKDNVLPTGYTQVEYLESSGTQYIDTGLNGNLNTKIEAKVYSAQVGTTSGYCIAGDITISTKAITLPFNFVSNGLYSRFGDKFIATGIQQQNGTYTFTVDKDGYYVDGVKIANFNTTTSFTTDRTIMLFGFTGLGRNYLIGKMYYCKIYDNNTLARNFIPAIDPSGTPCMYDLVSRTPFYNEGTGTFTTGKPVLPIVRFPVDPIPGYKTVNYLESTGTQYIDTGVIGTQNTSVELSITPTQINTKIFGCRTGTSSNNISIFYGSSADARLGIDFNNSNYATYRCQYAILNQKVIIKADKNSRKILDINGSVLAENNTVCTDTILTPDTLKLFDITNGFQSNLFIGTCSYCKIWDNNTLIRNFIPVVRLLDNKAGMWDTVNKQFYTTPVGDFITG